MTSDLVECVIPARGGSRRFPRKNIAPLGGRPLLGWAIAAAQASHLFSDVWVSTDDAEIAAVARRYGAKVHDRPAALAGDEATIAQVAVEFLDRREAAGATASHLGIVLPTAALLRADDLRGGWELLKARDADFAIAVTTYMESPFQALEEVDGHLRLFFGADSARQSQKLPRVVVDSGYFYLVRATALRETRALYGERLVGYPIPRERSVDIDEPGHLAIAEALLDGVGRGPGLRVEPAGAAHALLVWEWANDPVVRSNSFMTAPIPWDDHQAWWHRKLAAPDVRMWLLMDGDRPAGQIRYERRTADVAEVSVSVAAAERGRGLGTAILRMTATLAFRELGVAELLGWVKVDNTPSVRAFERAGYARTGPEVVHGTPCYRFGLRA